jgi:hypothetical protein
LRALAERNIAETHEIYERSKDALELVLESWERTFGATGQCAVALNHKIIDITQRSVNSGFDLARNLVRAENVAEAIEFQAAYWRNQLDTISAQAEEMRALQFGDAEAAEPKRRR